MNKVTLNSIEQARDVILAIIKPTPIERKELIKNCVEYLGYSKEEMANEQSGESLNLNKCRLGNALNQLIRAEYIEELEDDRLKISGEQLDTAEIKIEVEKIVLALTGKNSYTKEELLNEVNNTYFKNHKGFKNNLDYKNIVKGYAGTFIKSPFVQKSDGKYGTKQESLRERNERLINTLSSEEFEVHSVKLIYSYFHQFYYKSVCEGYHCGGNDDGGVDGYLTVNDSLLKCEEKILIQVKQKKSENKNAKLNTLHEVREFGGVLATRAEALKGIFVTNINYVPKKFIGDYKLKPLIYVNGELWLDMADKCGYSIEKHSV